ncbi:MAG: acetate--CoA ligase [Mariprofundaceae bacterium]|nr:acetate--CoA ligase [Mariprofundaceae bacterium]
MSQHIESILKEKRLFHPKPQADAAIASMPDYHALTQEFKQDYQGTWAELARTHLDWQIPFQNTLNVHSAPFYRWFEDGSLNVSENCLDRHIAAGHGQRTAIIWESEAGNVQYISYQALHEMVCKAANTLKRLGLHKGDTIILYMPMIPQAVASMLACSRIGAIHSVVFSAFSAQALRDRIIDAGASLVITTDGVQRRGQVHGLKEKVDTALEDCPVQPQVLVVSHAGNTSPKHMRDHDWDDCLGKEENSCEATVMNAEDPLFILYTSGSTGKPKGIVHSTGGYLLWAKLSMLWTFDFKAGQDVFWCTADIGWITGHTYSTYGPLCCGGTTLMYEGVPTYPNAGRMWQMCERHKVSVFYTAPTAIRALIKAGDQWPAACDLSSLRILGSVGEPINPEAWMWYHQQIGAEQCPIVDTWWQTETGGHMLAPMPFATPTKPGSATLPLPGIDAAVLDEEGNEVTDGKGGLLAIRQPWPSMLRGIWGDAKRYKETYWSKFNGQYYCAGDSARRDEDGYFWIMGRIDDVLNVSGHRLGTMEIESALASHPAVAEAAVVGRPHDLKGEAICAFVILKDDIDVQALRQHVSVAIGPIAKPDAIYFTEGLPKTRSGKIMRRLLRGIAAGQTIQQDTSTLEDQGIVQKLQEIVSTD